MVNPASSAAAGPAADSSIRPLRDRQLQALWQLSDAPAGTPPHAILRLCKQAPDPETAVRQILKEITPTSAALERKWRELIYDVWAAHHPDAPLLVDIPLRAGDVIETAALLDARAYLRLLEEKPLQMVQEEGEWLLEADAAYQVALQLPSLTGSPKIRLENEWQHHTPRRLRATLEALRLVRRQQGRLQLVKSRYQRFLDLPVTQQYYYLWHAEAYHVEWAAFAGIWGDYIHILQENLALLWSLCDAVLPGMPVNLRRWNQEVWDTYYPLWEQEGLLDKHRNFTALMSVVRIHSLPTAVTQMVVKDFFERYGLASTEGEHLAYTDHGYNLLSAEQSEDLPCALDLLH
ncbi:MAG: hypothetical protein COT71_02625 [Candidatus Andersenbacteria bacterium CG10_big_fil_rev_8_21_14_0_10_54_11]|uniref:Uncharacterized protein n=1 Tax=Candidatus Andersenbacteria bacterium CG10_big_fil_rev_8_21_14_0_10_54_11 TaxID=1974485 RepID=A0A2M6WZ91_9BACT|nr:MAG: hypothetical protein COT71_02625 [Candidatus Andersenbacteria bacterium CG10_big_fil_rev_8_21_14_0_10_54_11]